MQCRLARVCPHDVLLNKTDACHHLSFFGDQEGDFSIIFNSVAVEKNKDGGRDGSIDSVAAAKTARDEEQPGDKGAPKSSSLTSWIGRLCGWGR